MRILWGAFVVLCASAMQADAELAACAALTNDAEFVACIDAELEKSDPTWQGAPPSNVT